MSFCLPLSWCNQADAIRLTNVGRDVVKSISDKQAQKYVKSFIEKLACPKDCLDENDLV